jgi:hypothetical protein
MTEGVQQKSPARRLLSILAVFVTGAVAGLWFGRWENRVRQKAAGLLGEARFVEIMSEDWDQINEYWDSKPEVARAFLERQLRAHERLLQSVKTSSGNYALFTEDSVNKDMAFIHIKLAILCQRLNEPDCVSEHVTKATSLTNMSSNQVYAAMAKFQGTNKVQSLISE